MARQQSKYILPILAVLLMAMGLLWLQQKKPSATSATSDKRALDPATSARFAAQDRQVFAAYAGSASCRECHTNAFTHWENSHHARAERFLDPKLDRPAFDPPRSFRHGTQTSETRMGAQGFAVVTLGLAGKQPFTAERLIGVDPLWQLLIPAPGNRLQVTEIAYHPASNEWFNVYKEEDRQPGEWGHWTGRGMTWNTMCASCHNTRLRKNYDEASDAYATTKAEMGVGCEACHGPCQEHVQWQRAQTNAPPGARPRDPAVLRLTKDQTLSVCGGCHARRVDLTANFLPGDAFLDHYTPIIPDETDIYYPDAQVRDEDFEYVSFLSSRMYSLGVRCQDCHDIHSGKTLAQGNDLCLRCHKNTIDPLSHGHHPLDKAGSKCMDCHMPITVYMARHPRHDHGLTIPDPALTKEHNIPNACTRCHTDKPVDWSLETVQRWYGPRMQRHTQQRARWLARARAGDNTVVDSLLQMAREERIPMWRAIALGMLKRWVHDEKIPPVLQAAASDPAPLVRAMAARVLELLSPQNNPASESALRKMLTDPVRSVRIEAAWAMRHQLDANSRAGKDLQVQLDQSLDQPAGSLQKGVFYLDQRQFDRALPYLQRAVTWEPKTAPMRQALAVCLSALDRKEEAVQELEKACELAPRDVDLRFNLALAYAEISRLEAAIATFEKTVQLDARFGRAWYNLGLAYAARGEPGKAIEALTQAETINPASSDPAYARATILLKQGRFKDARQAARRALEITPNRPDAAELLHSLEDR